MKKNLNVITIFLMTLAFIFVSCSNPSSGTSTPKEQKLPEESKDTGITFSKENEYAFGVVSDVVYNEDGTVSYNSSAEYSGGGIIYYINKDKSAVNLEDYESIDIEFDYAASAEHWSENASKPQWCLLVYEQSENAGDYWKSQSVALDYFGDNKLSGTCIKNILIAKTGNYVGVSLKLNAHETNNASTDFCAVTLKKIKFNKKESESTEPVNWLSSSVPSIYETYKDCFDTIGIAAEYGNFGLKQNGSNKYTATYTQEYWGTPSELYYEEVQNGIAKHANSITLGNELKPQFLLQWWSGDGSKQELVDFNASNGKTIKVPASLNGENLIYATLNVAKKMNVKMRGHVLVWHSQTPDGFFAENYQPKYDGDLITNLVTPEEMTARQEWYIKTVLECVANWEKANNYGSGNHIIWAWDVVNEAMADDAGKTYSGTSQNWLRGTTGGTKDKHPNNGGSRWYQVYKNEDFIVNAFRFANAYAPEDVQLCYNDYNEYMDYSGGYKTSAIEHIAKIVKNGESQIVNGKTVAPRLDVIAMQSHVGTDWPGVNGYENALKRFLAIADVHVSEIDFSAVTPEKAVTSYAEYFTMLQNYGKNYSGEHKVKNITIWGINNESSWINPANDGGNKTYPLLFNLENNVDVNKKEVTYNSGKETLPQYDVGDTYKPNDAFWAVIQAHK
ncbi:MAG: endo-1,4-beta-xylanase [Treponema sp.]|nr:endo-1,4-beta-xylanase [Treponema sp.]